MDPDPHPSQLTAHPVACGPVAVFDEDAEARRVLCAWLRAEGYVTVEYESGRCVLDDERRDLAVVCLSMPGPASSDVPGMHVLQHLRARDPELPVIVVSSQREVHHAVSAMRAGAHDYLARPLERERVVDAVRRAVAQREIAARMQLVKLGAGAQCVLGSLVGQSAPMVELARQIERVLESDVSVCISGESGTGKELVAQAIHTVGRRRRGPFVAINCAAIPAALQESELFGHERGAFTGAAGVHRGRFEQAHGGTLFLDELGEMAPATQVSLLRTLQERTIRRVGGTTEIPVNVRTIAATHRDLEAEVRAGRFREDLYYRLVVYPIRVPPLRVRHGDIPLLVAHFQKLLQTDVGRALAAVSPEALDALTRHDWPGNVRELQNVIHRVMLACHADRIALADLPPEFRDRVLPSVAQSSALPVPEDESVVPLRQLERQAIVRALQVARGSIGKAAGLLGIGRSTLYRRLADLQLLDAGA